MSTAGRSRTACRFTARAPRDDPRGRSTTARSASASRSTPSTTRYGLRRPRHPRRPGRARRSSPLSIDARRLLGPQHRHPELGRGCRLDALLRDQPPSRVHAGGQVGLDQAVHQRRPVHRPGRHGRGDHLRPVRHHRRRPAVDRRPVPPEEDRGGPRRGHPRVHRLQRLRLALGDGRPSDLVHPEPHRRRGVPPRLAPGAVPTRPANAGKPVLIVGAGPAGMEAASRAGQARLRRASTSSTPQPSHGRSPQLDDHDARAAAVAQRGHRVPRAADRRSSTTSSSIPNTRLDAPSDPRSTAPRSSSSRRAPHWARRRHERRRRTTSIAGADASLPQRRDARAAGRRREATSANASWSSTATATTWAPRPRSSSPSRARGSPTPPTGRPWRPTCAFTLEEQRMYQRLRRARRRDHVRRRARRAFDGRQRHD